MPSRPREASPAILAKGVSHSFGSGELETQVLFDVDLRLDPGEVVILSGPSGSGKTTLLTLIAALRTVRRGEMKVLGCDVRRCSEPERTLLRRRIGFVFQQHNLLGFLTARQNVQLMFQLHPEISRSQAHRRSAEILEKVGLGRHLDDVPAHLSGGQQQRVAIARALACSPALILADEPTASLDGQTGRAVVDLLLAIAQDRGSSVLMVTHDPRVLDAAHRIIHIEDGAIEDGAGLDPPKKGFPKTWNR